MKPTLAPCSHNARMLNIFSPFPSEHNDAVPCLTQIFARHPVIPPFKLTEQAKAKRGLDDLRAKAAAHLTKLADITGEVDPVAAFHLQKRAVDVQSWGAASTEGSA